MIVITIVIIDVVVVIVVAVVVIVVVAVVVYITMIWHQAGSFLQTVVCQRCSRASKCQRICLSDVSSYLALGLYIALW